MNGTSKLFACLAVFVMLAASFVCIANVSNSDGSSNAIDSTETVVLCTDKSYEDNKENLAKLGLGSNSWSWNEERGSYRLLLKDVVFNTTANVALVLATDTADANPKFTIKLEGENVLTAGSEQKCEFTKHSIALYALHYHYSEGKVVSYDDFTLTIVGDGTLNASSNVTGYRTDMSCGIAVEGTLAFCGQPKIFAVADDVTFNVEPSDISVFSPMFSVGSIGIQAPKIVTSSNDLTYGPKIHAIAGDVDIAFMKSETQYGGFMSVSSSGIMCGSCDLKNATISSTGGNLDYANAYGCLDQDLIIMLSFSLGLGMPTSIGKETYDCSVDGCHIVASSGDVDSITIAISDAISFAKSTNTSVIKDSIIKADAGDAVSTTTAPSGITIDAATSSNGLYCESNLEVSDSLLSLNTGETAMCRDPSETNIYSAGLFVDGNISVKGSIVRAISNDTHCAHTYGIEAGSDGTKALSITDSEIKAAGKDNAIIAGSVTVNGTPRCMVSIQPDGTEKTIAATDLTSADNKWIYVAYKYDVIYLGTFGAFDFYRLTDNDITFAPYDGPVPEGKLFDCYIVNGERYEPGDAYVIDDVALVSIEFKDKPQDQSWIIPLVIVISLLAIFALAAGAIYYRSKN